MASTNPVIKLNVGGIIMQTYKSTIKPLKFFEAYLQRWLSQNPSDEIFIDYDPTLFIHLLNKLRDSTYKLPKTIAVQKMCEYFGYELDYLFLCPKMIEHIPYTSKNNLGYRDGICVVEYTINTLTHRLISIKIKMENFKCIESLVVAFRDKYIMDIRQCDGESVLKRIHTSDQVNYEIWELPKCFVNMLQDCGELRIRLMGKFNDTSVCIQSK